MSSTQPAAAAEHLSDFSESLSESPSQSPSESAVTPDHPGVNMLFALLAYGEVAAFYRLTDEARMAPNLRGRIAMASMAAAEMGHYEMLRDALATRGIAAEDSGANSRMNTVNPSAGVLNAPSLSIAAPISARMSSTALRIVRWPSGMR